MKKIITVIVFGLMVIFFLYRLRLVNAELEDMTRQKDYFESAKSALEEMMFTTAAANLKIRQYVPPRQERKLLRDSLYLDLIGKYE